MRSFEFFEYFFLESVQVARWEDTERPQAQ